MNEMKKMDAFSTIPNSFNTPFQMGGEDGKMSFRQQMAKAARQEKKEDEEIANNTAIHFAEGDAERIIQARKQAYETKQEVPVVITAFELNRFSDRAQRDVVARFCEEALLDSKYYRLHRDGELSLMYFPPVYQIKRAVKEDCIKFQLSFNGKDQQFCGGFEGEVRLMHAIEELRRITKGAQPAEITEIIKSWLETQEQEMHLKQGMNFDLSEHDHFYRVFSSIFGSAGGDDRLYELQQNMLLEEFEILLDEGAFDGVSETASAEQRAVAENSVSHKPVVSDLLISVCSGKRKSEKLSYKEFVSLFKEVYQARDKVGFNEDYDGMKRLMGITNDATSFFYELFEMTEESMTIDEGEESMDDLIRDWKCSNGRSLAAYNAWRHGVKFS